MQTIVYLLLDTFKTPQQSIPILMKSRLLFLFVFCVGVFSFNAQEVRTKWKQSIKKISDCECDLVFDVSVDPGWHLYSQIPVDDGPLPTEFKFKKSPDYELVGKTKESKPIEEMDEVFGAKVFYYELKATFTQRIKILSPKKFQVSGKYFYQVCTNVKCENAKDDFVFDLDGSSCKNTGVKLIPVTNVNTDSLKKDSSLLATQSDTLPKTQSVNSSAVPPSHNQEASTAGSKKEDSLWSIFIKSFLGGLFAVFTPCLFPLIPMNVSFFTKKSKTKAQGVSNSMLYSFFVILIYVALGFGVSWALGPDRLHAMSTNKYVNIVFFAIFLIFAISFFGAFEITLPSGFVNKMDSMSDKGGFIGTFFMAFTLVLVSFSCTGPIASSLLIDAASTGKVLAPGIGMLGFGLALALPFGFFAFAPALMNSLPKSGGWLNMVKVCLGFIELAFAMKFISNADLVTQSHIITREVFISSWILIFGMMGVYLVGAFKMSHDSETKHLSIPRLMFAMLSFFIVIYMLPGMWGAPLKLFSGILPPADYTETKNGFLVHTNDLNLADDKFKPYIHVNGNGIPMFKNNYDMALEYAKKVNKPLMIDFTGHNCANCRKTEDYIWSDEKVVSILKNDVVLVSLYADEDTELPANEMKKVQWYGRERTLETVGEKWKYFEFQRYNAIAQPLYIIVDHNEKTLAGPRGYESGVDAYIDWMNSGISKFKK
jgi:thiol:disulfide interchange protein